MKIDFRNFGLCNIKCSTCEGDLDLSEIDLDDVTTHNPMCFELHLMCYKCSLTQKFKFEIKEVKK